MIDAQVIAVTVALIAVVANSTAHLPTLRHHCQ